jgi:hypothetical protein
MKQLTIIAMPTSEAQRVRATMQDDFGNRLAPVISDGSGPCRHCLRYASPGDPLLLFSYKPFDKPAPYQEVGPVFLHADGCERHPADGGFPVDFSQRPLVLRPYDARDYVQDSQVYAEAGEAESAARALLADPAVAYVHARSRSRGCFMFRIERAEAPAT